MPLYDCMLLLKTTVTREVLAELVTRVARRACQRNGVVTDVKSFGKVSLAYGIRKLDGRHFQGHLMQMTMMVPPSFPQELHYLNKEDRLLRWLVVKHRDTVYGLEFLNADGGRDELRSFSHGHTKGDYDIEIDSDDEDSDDSDDEEYAIEEEEEEEAANDEEKK
ncbi:hypothetical protein Zm00014a_000476 [Zea mays]|uniref:Uncharacterized protein n=2 Tax=Zea mays TaxID=4577 RepID=A0A8J8YK75_MAIZE|nr:hypothetical protein [Zea mays]PWZ30645.1 hypothetical protein Zm00014a_000476 [Zea mays]|eukprot:NP_001143791.1 uncharacterized LOC100276559 [Zea mays]